MRCDPFSVEFSGSAEELFNKLSIELENVNGILIGDSDSTAGTFHVDSPIGDFDGTYSIAAHKLDVTMTKRPFLISCGRIEEEVQNRLTAS